MFLGVNQTQSVQRGRRRHVQEASGRWRTRLGKRNSISSKKQFQETSGGFSDFVTFFSICGDAVMGSTRDPHCAVPGLHFYTLNLEKAWMTSWHNAWPGPRHCGICICKIPQSCILNHDCHCISHLDIKILYRSSWIFQPNLFFHLSALQVVVGILKGLGKISVARRENSCWVQYNLRVFFAQLQMSLLMLSKTRTSKLQSSSSWKQMRSSWSLLRASPLEPRHSQNTSHLFIYPWIYLLESIKIY